MLRTDVKFLRGKVSVSCSTCGKVFEFPCSGHQRLKYLNKYYVQDIFPELSCDLRELFISGVCPDCWDKMFKYLEE